jgi:hypothetical protein
MNDNGGPARGTPKPAYDLSDAEKRDLTQLIQQGRPLPEKYRFILFEDKREVELVWNGKTREVCTTVLPFQSLEHIDEPRKETKVQEDLFLDSRGRQHGGWTNKLIWGDNKLILSSLKSGALREQIEAAGGLKLIYIDPPFDYGRLRQAQSTEQLPRIRNGCIMDAPVQMAPRQPDARHAHHQAGPRRAGALPSRAR